MASLVFVISFMSGVFYSEGGTFAPTYAPPPSPAAVSPVPVVATKYNYTTVANDVDAMQQIITQWKQSNSDLHSTLPGWSSESTDPCFGAPWQGIVCSYQYAQGGITTATAKVIGITLTNTPIIGTLPPAIGNLTNLVLLTVADNPGLSGSIPKEFGNISLTSLDLHNNSLSGIIPPEVPTAFLDQIDLSYNGLVGPIPLERGSLKNASLQVLQLSHNQLNGSIPDYLSGLRYLNTFNLFNNSFSGPLPDFLFNMTTLTSINVGQNQLSGKVLSILNNEAVNLSANISSLDISSNNFTGPIPNLTRLSRSLQHLDLSNNPFDTSTTVPIWLQSLENLISLRLSNISLSGDLPSFLLHNDTINNLETLALDRNSISGENIDLSNINPNLKLVNLTSNNIKGVSNSGRLVSDFVSSGGLRYVDFLLQDTPYCKANAKNVDVTNDATFFCSNHPPVLFSQDRKNQDRVVLLSSVIVAVILAAFLIGPFVFLVWKTRREKRRLLLEIQKEFAKNDVQPTLYTYSELRAATNDFHPDMKLGQGGFGIVYKGVQPDGTELAVKQLSSRSQQALDEFLNEVVLITGVRHRNLVKLKGCCIRDDVRRLLVYEYIENNNLAEVLFDGIGEQDLNWGVRYNICLGVAQGLHYLHEIAQPRIIHRDIKAPNILLDKHMNAKIADFGLARLFPDEESHISTLHIAGTMGYMAPEYASQGQLTEKADVFSFGVLVLEILSGRKNIEPKLSTEEVYLIEWAWKLHEGGRALDVIDSTMSIRGHEEDVARVVNMALLCVQPTGAGRPSMARVVSVLKGELIDTEVVIRETRYDKIGYAAFLATAQSGSDLSLVTDRKSVERKPLLDGGSTSGTSDRSRSSASVELSKLRSPPSINNG